MSDYKIRLKIGDTVIVRKGKDKGKTGKVVSTHPKLNKVTVEGINIVKKHRKPAQGRPQGSIEEITKPIWVANVGIIHPTEDNKTSRIGYKIEKDGKKKRVFIQANYKEIK